MATTLCYRNYCYNLYVLSSPIDVMWLPRISPADARSSDKIQPHYVDSSNTPELYSVAMPLPVDLCQRS